MKSSDEILAEIANTKASLAFAEERLRVAQADGNPAVEGRAAVVSCYCKALADLDKKLAAALQLEATNELIAQTSRLSAIMQAKEQTVRQPARSLPTREQIAHTICESDRSWARVEWHDAHPVARDRYLANADAVLAILGDKDA